MFLHETSRCHAGVFVLATIGLAEVIPSAFLAWLASALLILLVLLWIYVAAGTVRSAVTRTLFIAPCTNTGPQEIGSDFDLAALQEPVL